MASRTPPAALIDQNIAERLFFASYGTGQAAHTAIAAATQHCEHAAIIRTVVVYGAFLLVGERRIKIKRCKTDDNANAMLPKKVWI